MRRITVEKTRSIPISYSMVKAAYKKVKSNRGSGGVDGVSLQDFQENLVDNLYKIWNRMASGSYFPPPVLEVSIAKSNGTTRKLGIPTIGDRIAQQVIKDCLEPRLEKEFTDHSYGYRPLRSAHQALDSVQQNVLRYSWVIDMDIQKFFDELDHVLLMKALDRHVEEPWIKRYVKRWLEASVSTKDGQLLGKNGKGTPQGGVISPLLANLYLHYTLDKWMEKNISHLPFVRYADDIIVHCSSEEEAKTVLSKIRTRLAQCSLQLNEEKTKIVYCKNYIRKLKHKQKNFDFLGFRFQPRACTAPNREGVFLGFSCAISPVSVQRITKQWRQTKFHLWSSRTIQELADWFNPQIRGIIRYYGKFKKWELLRLFRIFHKRLAKWALRKYKRFKRKYRLAYRWLKTIQKDFPNLFYHWNIGFKL